MAGGSHGFTNRASDFSNQDFFNSLDRDVRSPQQFRDRLMSETANRDQPHVNRLFQAYFYN